MYQSKDEWELLQGIKDRNEKAIQEFHDLVIRKATSIALEYVKDQGHAEDLARKAFNATILKGIEFDSIQKAQQYVYKATKNKSLNFIKSRDYRNRPLLCKELPDVRADTDIGASLEYAELNKEMIEKFEKLPAKYQLIINLHADNKSTAEIASKINKGPQYVLNVINRIKKIFTNYLKERS